MASNDDLDNFFKKKDRKAKPKTGLLTNNEELLKRLVIVTEATTAFKENLDLIDDEDDPLVADETMTPAPDPSVVLPAPSKSSQHPKIKAQADNADRSSSATSGQQQDEWEEFEQSNPKYEELRLKFSRANRNDNDDDDDRSDHSMTHDENDHPHDERDQQKEKPVWKLDQLKSNETAAPAPPAAEEENRRPPSPAKPVATGAYRPPQLRGASGVTVVSGPASRPSKKKQPNIASTEEFPTLGAAVNKK